MKTPLVAILMISLLALSLTPLASAKIVSAECDGYEGIAKCAVTHTICVAEYALKGRCGGDVGTMNTIAPAGP
jgi:hypothetical protein